MLVLRISPNRKSHLQPFLQVAFSPYQSLLYSSNAALITALTVVPCFFALLEALCHTSQAMRIDRIGVAIIQAPHIQTLNPNTNQENLHQVMTRPTTGLWQSAK
jgi:hypothetical protein